MKDPRFSREAIYKLGVVAPQVMMWLSNMDAALKLQRRNIFDAILRYEELVEHKVDAAIALLEALYPDVAAKMRQQVWLSGWKKLLSSLPFLFRVELTSLSPFHRL